MGKSDNVRNKKENRKEIITKFKVRKLRAITLQGAIKKSQILISQYWKKIIIG